MSARPSPFHAGEREVQERAGVRERAELLGQHMIRDYMPEQHRAFFAQLPFLVVGSLSADGQPWASIVAGPPGFASTPSATRLQIAAAPLPGDPLAQHLELGKPLGVLGIQLETRRRNRANGRVVAHAAGGFSLEVEQSFGNCPKFISVRSLQPRAASPPPAARELDPRALPSAALRVIAHADTCFIASASARRPERQDASQGVDVSHRGGPAGFIAQELGASGGLRLRIPDYAGNNAFNTLGNISVHPRAGLLVPDFTSGDLLSLAGACTLEWSGRERALCFDVERALRWQGVLPALAP